MIWSKKFCPITTTQQFDSTFLPHKCLIPGWVKMAGEDIYFLPLHSQRAKDAALNSQHLHRHGWKGMPEWWYTSTDAFICVPETHSLYNVDFPISSLDLEADKMRLRNPAIAERLSKAGTTGFPDFIIRIRTAPPIKKIIDYIVDYNKNSHGKV